MGLHTLLETLRSHGRYTVYGLLIVVPVILAIGQVLFKLASSSFSAFSYGSFRLLAVNPYLLAALALYGGATVLWLYVLSRVKLGHAYPFIALTFVIVPILAHFILGETFGSRYVLGLMLVVLGVLLCQL
jgi:undecaprenyl phosphate-alpha-L-ara4N flippase subunit ArnE